MPHNHYCTYLDSGYLARGLALYRSLERHDEDFTLYVLCWDDDSYALLNALDTPKLVPIAHDELERADPELAATQVSRSRVEYYWTSTASLPRWLLSAKSLPLVTYLDADLFFFASPAPLYDALGDRSVLAVEHGFAPGWEDKVSTGRFNVGALCFRNDEDGLRCLADWRARCIEWCYAREEAGRFGDQKYLDEWPALLGDSLAIPDHPGLGLGPWNEGRFRITAGPGGGPRVDEHALVYFHFHGLRLFSSRAGRIHAGQQVQRATRQRLYLPYLAAVRAAYRELRGVRAGFNAGLQRPSARELAAAVYRRGLLLSIRGRGVTLR